MERKHLDLNGTIATYLEAGSGPVLLCLHAVGHDADDYGVLLRSPQITARFRVIALDFPGHGGSSPSAAKDISATRFARFTTEFLRTLGVQRVAITGNSIGGAVALRLASGSDGPTVNALILANPGGLDNRRPPGDLVLRTMAAFFRAGERGAFWFRPLFRAYYGLVLRRSTPASRQRRESLMATAYALAPMLARAWESFALPEDDLRNRIHNIRCPVVSPGPCGTYSFSFAAIAMRWSASWMSA